MAKFAQVLEWPYRKPTVGDLIGSWSAYVLQIADDLSNFTSEVVGEFGYHDYIGALFARNFVEEAIDEVSITKDDVEYYLIRTADEYFRALTRNDPGKVVIASEPDFAKYALNEKYWWLRRIPNGGALGYEVSRVARAQAGLKY
ncbi:hypothetical protein [Microbacterium testaceum]|uniref:hypothetical protein n=1 Tax=Microbacterium testaceum TaxID=2033 RepID=UPI0007348134|nr:hypothetical protein [Microbacterium testaceum]